MTCPCCERNARLLTPEEYDRRHDDGMSEGDMSKALTDVILSARENVDGTGAAENRDRRSHLRAIRGGGLGPERLAVVGHASLTQAQAMDLIDHLAPAQVVLDRLVRMATARTIRPYDFQEAIRLMVRARNSLIQTAPIPVQQLEAAE